MKYRLGELRRHGELFPPHHFRMAYDLLCRDRPHRADKDYLRILHLAARENEAAVDDALGYLIGEELPLTVEAVEEFVRSATELPSPKDITIERVDLTRYDALLISSCTERPARARATICSRNSWGYGGRVLGMWTSSS